MINYINKYVRLLRKYNKLENEYETLKEAVKDDCFKRLMDKLGEPQENKRLRKENKRLRIRNKELKSQIIK